MFKFWRFQYSNSLVIPILFLTVFCVPGLRAEPLQLAACKLDEAYAPISMPDQEVEGERVIRLAAAQLGTSVRFDPQPWARCLDGIRNGPYDLIVGPSANPSFFPFIAYPRKGGEVDESRAIGTVKYVVVRKRGAVANWDGTKFTGLTLPVYYGNTAVIVRRKLDDIGVMSDDSVRYAEQLVSMLQFDRIEVAITRDNLAQKLLAEPEFNNLEIVAEPFVSFEAHLGASMDLAVREGPFLEQLWDKISMLRQAR